MRAISRSTTTFSPDGAWIVYTSERAGINDEEPMVQEVVFGPQMREEGNPFWLRPAE